MTPKEKANEIFRKICFAIADEVQEDGFITNVKNAKKCALVAVDEIINCDSFFKTFKDCKPFVNYWYEVKQELEKL